MKLISLVVMLALFTGCQNGIKTCEEMGYMDCGWKQQPVILAVASKKEDFSNSDFTFLQNKDSLFIKVFYASEELQGCVEFQNGNSPDTHCQSSNDWIKLDQKSRLSENPEWKLEEHGFSFSGPAAINVLKNHPYFVPGNYTFYFKDANGAQTSLKITIIEGVIK